MRVCVPNFTQDVAIGRHLLRSDKVVSYRNGEGENGAQAHAGLFQPRLHAYAFHCRYVALCKRVGAQES